ncbi:MAG: pilus assembly protein [Mesorhizobium amorphae]|nr:MAG: pilus assembly protein [Mesorhizobium amorphae]
MIEMAMRLKRFLADRRGVAATEFALIAPVLLCCYFLSMEVSQAVEVSKKVSRIGSMVADLITQQPEITSDEVKAIMQIGEALVQPYNRSKPEITVTAIRMSDASKPQATVAWSRRLVNGKMTSSPPFAPGSTVTVPDRLLVAKGFLIRVQGHLDYEPVLTWSAANTKPLGILDTAIPNVSMGETYHLRPRQSDAILCKDC